MDLKRCRVLVTPTSYGRNNPTLKDELEAAVGDVLYNTTGKPLTSEQLKALLPGCHGFIAGLDTIDRAALAVATDLKVIARYGAGVDRVDLDAAREQGVVVANTPGANAVAVAELAIGLMLTLARSIPMASESTKAGEWPRLRGVSLEGKTVGVLGLGAIGKAVARRLQGFDCSLVAHDPYADVAFAKENNIRLAPLHEVVQQADFLSLHLPVTKETAQIVNAEFLGRMKRDAFLINTSRGELIDEAALYEALKADQLRGAALDAFSPEPPAADNPLLTLPQVIATPHTGAHTDGATENMGRGALEACLAVLRGEEPRSRVI